MFIDYPMNFSTNEIKRDNRDKSGTRPACPAAGTGTGRDTHL